NQALRVPGEDQSNQAGELLAVVVALQIVPTFAPITFVTDSMYVIHSLTEHLGAWEDRGWVGISNSLLFQAAAYHLRCCSATTSFKWVKGHNNDPGNEAADLLAREGALKDTPADITLSVPPPFRLPGVKLSSLTQSLAYQAVRELKTKDLPLRTRSAQNLSRIQDGLLASTQTLEHEANLWLALRNSAIRPVVQQFNFKATHGAYRVGDHWAHIPGYKDRAPCPICPNLHDNLDHILEDCAIPDRDLIWSLARDLWPSAYGPWPALTYGAMIAAGKLTVTPPRRRAPDPRTTRGTTATMRPNPGASRLLRILVSESAYLIWALRCERVIQGKSHNVNSVLSRWTNAINCHLRIDYITATKICRTKRALRSVFRTWALVLKTYHPNGPPEAPQEEVLDGIRPPGFLIQQRVR
ncbi:RnaseH-domain-containing protein, partial [Heliocybe sulcata]